MDLKEILLVETRISGIESFSMEKIFPIFLKKGSYFIELIALNALAAVFYSVVLTLNYICFNYWIVKGRQTIKQLLKGCFICKYVQRKSLLRPEIPSLS